MSEGAPRNGLRKELHPSALPAFQQVRKKKNPSYTQTLRQAYIEDSLKTQDDQQKDIKPDVNQEKGHNAVSDKRNI